MNVMVYMEKVISCMVAMWLLAMQGVAQTDAERVMEPDSVVPVAVGDVPDGQLGRLERPESYKFKPLQLVIPGALIGIGLIGLESDWLKYQNREMRDELQENIDGKFSMDDFAQYVPMAAAYGLNLCGVKGRHGYKDLTVILGTAYVLMGLTVNTMKCFTKVERPDGSSRNSFPSGHTATAFMGAEFLRREFRDTSPWIGVAGYAVAVGTGFFRMYNNRHWLTDVMAGAGVGILSVQAAYWLYPVVSKAFPHKKRFKVLAASPYVSRTGKGISCSLCF